MVKKVNVGKIFHGLQLQMRGKLSFSREVISHPTTKGDVSECEWIDMLASYLPERYCANKAFVIDSTGQISDQIDIVIFDRHYSPFLLRQNGCLYVPAECVYAVIEVKQDLNKRNIEYAAKKAASVRKLVRTADTIIQADRHDAVEPKKPPKILAAILTLGGTLDAKTSITLQNLSEQKCLNIGCSLSGTFFALEDMHPWLNNKRPYKLKKAVANESSLVLFFLTLVQELRKMGTVPAMNIKEYLKTIEG